MYTRKNNGLRIEPWGTPADTVRSKKYIIFQPILRGHLGETDSFLEEIEGKRKFPFPS